MKSGIKILIGVLIFALLALWIHHRYGVVKASRVSYAIATSPLSNVAAVGGLSSDEPAGTATVDVGLINIDGTAIMDASHGTPAVPYISYTNARGNTATKQLIFADQRGCLPGAGDIPCVPTYPASNAYPQLSTGQHIQVHGYIRENRFLVTSMNLVS